MKRCMRFLLRLHLLPAAGVSLLFAAVSLLLGFWGDISFFRSYYTALPLVVVVLLFVFAASFTTSGVSLALSMGARRHDLAAALVGIFLLGTIVCLALTVLTAMVPALAGWTDRDTYGVMLLLSISPVSWPMLALVYLLAQGAGAFAGLLMLGHKVLGGILIALFWVLASGLVFVVVMIPAAALETPLGVLPVALYLILGGLSVLFLFLTGRWVLRAVVR